MWIALLPFEVLNHNAQHPLLPLAVLGEGLAPFSWFAEFSWVSPLNTYYWTFVWLSLVNLSHLHFILRPARRPWQVRREFLAPPTIAIWGLFRAKVVGVGRGRGAEEGEGWGKHRVCDFPLAERLPGEEAFCFLHLLSWQGGLCGHHRAWELPFCSLTSI